MCGRYTLTKPMKAIESHFAAARVKAVEAARYNIAPSQEAPVVLVQGSERVIGPMVWGLLPSWARNRQGFINARAETAAEKPSFRAAFRARRCLVPADGFFEWEKSARGKVPHYFRLRSAGLFAFAGLWEAGQDAPSTFAILTTSANSLVSPWHDRMPVILPPGAYAPWLDPAAEKSDLTALLTPYAAGDMEQHVVSRDINSALNDNPSLIEPVPS